MPRSCARAAGTGMSPSLVPRRRAGSEADRVGRAAAASRGAPGPRRPARVSRGRFLSPGSPAGQGVLAAPFGNVARSCPQPRSRSCAPCPALGAPVPAARRGRAGHTHAMRWQEAASPKFFRVFDEKGAFCCCSDSALRHTVGFLGYSARGQELQSVTLMGPLPLSNSV